MPPKIWTGKADDDVKSSEKKPDAKTASKSESKPDKTGG